MKKLTLNQQQQLAVLTAKIQTARDSITGKLDVNNPTVQDMLDDIFDFTETLLTKKQRQQKFGYVEALVMLQKLVSQFAK